MRKGKMTCEKRVRHTQLMSYWQLLFLDRTFGSTFNCASSFNSSSFWIWFKKFLIQFWPFSFGPGTSPTASTRFVHKLKGRKLFVSPSAGFSSPRQCVRDNCRLRYKCWQYFTRSSKCRTRRSKPSIFPILIAALASLNIVRPISPVVWSGIPKGSSGIPWIMVWSSMPNDTISFAVSTMEIISASAEDSAGTSCFLEKNLIQHPRYTKIAPDTQSKPQDASQKETISLDSPAWGHWGAGILWTKCRFPDSHFMKTRIHCSAAGLGLAWNLERKEMGKERSALERAAHANWPRTRRQLWIPFSVRGSSPNFLTNSLWTSSSLGIKPVWPALMFSPHDSKMPTMYSRLTPKYKDDSPSWNL